MPTRLKALVLAGLVALAGPGLAQEGTQNVLRSPVLTIDSDRLFSESLFGRRIAEEVRAETEALAAENRRIEAALTEEVQRLTERRPTMPVEEFRAEADAFDMRVQGIRRAQDAKERALDDSLQRGREALFEAAAPILGRIMLESGAAVILERRSVFLSAAIVDVTDAAIAAIDAELGDGRDPDRRAPAPPEEAPTPPDPLPDPAPAPDADPDPAPPEP